MNRWEVGKVYLLWYHDFDKLKDVFLVFIFISMYITAITAENLAES